MEAPGVRRRDMGSRRGTRDQRRPETSSVLRSVPFHGEEGKRSCAGRGYLDKRQKTVSSERVGVYTPPRPFGIKEGKR